MTKVITPYEVGSQQSKQLPDDIIRIVNERIAASWDGRIATVMQADLVARIQSAMELKSSQEVFDNGWLNFEVAYRSAGWEVVYDKPVYNETYPAKFIFRRGSQV